MGGANIAPDVTDGMFPCEVGAAPPGRHGASKMVNEGLKTLGFLRGPDGRDFAAARRGAGQLARLALELDLAGIGAHPRRGRRVNLAEVHLADPAPDQRLRAGAGGVGRGDVGPEPAGEGAGAADGDGRGGARNREQAGDEQGEGKKPNRAHAALY